MRFPFATSRTSRLTLQRESTGAALAVVGILVLILGLSLHLAQPDRPARVVSEQASAGTPVPESSSLSGIPDRVEERAAADRQFLAAVSAQRSSRSGGRSPTTTRTAASSSRSVAPRSNATVTPETSGSPDDAFWRRLANCECASGSCANGAGYFQFTDPGTARKAGYVRGSSYEEQLAAAKRWLAQIGGRGGTTAGWPTCWWRALKSG